MLKKIYRFRGRGSLGYLHHQGKTVRNRSLGLRFVANSRRADSRAAVVVTRKLLKSAPKRNRIRRRVYEVLRTNWAAIKPGYDMAFSVYDRELGDISYSELERLVIELLRAGKIWKNETLPQAPRLPVGAGD